MFLSFKVENYSVSSVIEKKAGNCSFHCSSFILAALNSSHSYDSSLRSGHSGSSRSRQQGSSWSDQ